MVASAGDRVVYVRNKEAATVIPSTQLTEECKVPEHTLWIHLQGPVELVKTQTDVLNRFSHRDQHNSGVYGIFIFGSIDGVIVQVRVKTRVPRRQNDVKGWQ